MRPVFRFLLIYSFLHFVGSIAFISISYTYGFPEWLIVFLGFTYGALVFRYMFKRFRHFFTFMSILFLLSSSLQAFEIGVNTHCGCNDTFSKISNMGGAWIRADFNWSAIEPKRDQWDWSTTDTVVECAKRQHLKIDACLISIPQWAGLPVPNVLDWMNFVKALSGRYKDSIQVYSILNEPNLEEFWMGSAEDYVNVMLKPASVIIKSQSPNSLVGGPDLAHLYSGRLGIEDFFKTIHRLHAEDSIDVLTHHLYGDKDFESKIYGFKFLGIQYKKGLLQMLKQNGLGDKDIWITECGENKNDNEQERVILKQLKVLKSIPQVKVVIVYQLMDSSDHEERWGILRSDGSEKPSYKSIKEQMRK